MMLRTLLPIALSGVIAGNRTPDPGGSVAAVTGDRTIDARASAASMRPLAVATADTVREYRGTYESGFEVSWFHPCDAKAGDDRWWVTLTSDALRQRDSLAALRITERPRAVYVRWRGTISARMPAGHMGQGSRYMLVSEVLDLRPADGTSCTSA